MARAKPGRKKRILVSEYKSNRGAPTRVLLKAGPNRIKYRMRRKKRHRRRKKIDRI